MCADLYLETESSRSAVYYAGWRWKEKFTRRRHSVSIAKMYASDAGRTVGNRASRSMAAWVSPGKRSSLFYRRAKASETAFGDATFIASASPRWLSILAAASAKSALDYIVSEEPFYDRSSAIHKRQRIAVITINNPPVNALSPGVPEAFQKALDRLLGRQLQKGRSDRRRRTFVAARTLKNSARGDGQPRGAGLLPLLLKIERKQQPVMCHSRTAFGGGWMAMAGHYRVALSPHKSASRSKARP